MFKPRLKWHHLGDAVKATRATLQTLAERLPSDEIKSLTPQLPTEIASYLNAIPAGVDKFGLDELFKRVSQREGVQLQEAVYHAKIVMSVLQSSITKSEMTDIKSQLPDEFAQLLTGPEGPLKKAA